MYLEGYSMDSKETQTFMLLRQSDGTVNEYEAEDISQEIFLLF